MTISSPESDKLKQLDEKIARAKYKGTELKLSSDNHKNANYAWRMVLELVIGMLIGFLIGYGLDKFFNSAPLMIIIMSLLGFGAGIRTMMKTAAEFTVIDDQKK